MGIDPYIYVHGTYGRHMGSHAMIEHQYTNASLLTECEAAEYLHFSPRFLQARRVRGDGPLFVRVSARAIRYRRGDLENWVEQRVRTSTSDQGNLH